MESRSTGKTRMAGIAAALVLAAAAAGAGAQGWSPQRNVEIVVGSAPGGSNDNTARTMERVLLGNKLVPTAIPVLHRAGGGGRIAYPYVSPTPGDAPYLHIGSSSLTPNHLRVPNTL